MEILVPGRLLSKDLFTSESFDCYDAFGQGLFQWRLVVLCTLSSFLVNIHGLVIPLISSDVDHWCKQPATFNVSDVVWKNEAMPVGRDGRLNRCHLYKHPEDPNDTESVPCQEWEYDDDQARTSIVSEWNLVCERRVLMTVIVAVYNSGACFLTVVAGSIADSIGREPVFLAGVSLLTVSTLAGCLSTNYVMQTTMRFLSSGSSSVVMSVAFVSLFEVTIHENRPLHIVVSVMVGFMISEVYYLSFVPLKLWWPLKQAIFLLPTVLLLPFFCTIHESPRWLVSKARLECAEAVMLAAAEVNRFSYADTASMVHKLKMDVVFNSQRLPAIDSRVLGGCSVPRRVITMCASCFSIMFASFVSIYIPVQREELWFNYTTFVMKALGCAVMYPMLRKVKMLTLMITCFAVLGTLQCLQSIAAGAEVVVVIVAAIIVSKTVVLSGVILTFTYVLELLPTAIRGTAACWAYACGRLGALAAFVAPALQLIGRVDLVYAFAGLLLFASVIAQCGLPRATSVECAKEAAKQQRSTISQRSIEHMKSSLVARKHTGSSDSRSSGSSRGRFRDDHSHGN